MKRTYISPASVGVDFTCERLIATSPTSVGVVEKDGGVDAGEAGSNRKGFGGNLWDEMN